MALSWMQTLHNALVRTRELLSESEVSAFSSTSVSTLVREFDDLIARLDRGASVDRKRLQYLFAPTAAIQEMSIDNDWGDEFIKLSNVVDEYCG